MFKTLTYIENLLILGSIVTESVSISAFAFLIGISVSFASSALKIKTCAMNAIIKKHKSIIRKKKKKHNKIVLLSKIS